MTIKPRPKPKRLIRIKGQTPAETPTERASRAAVKFIFNHPQYNYIVQAMREGTSNSDLAHFCIENGYFDVNIKTAVSYFQYFRKAHPDTIKAPAIMRDGTTAKGYDHIVDGNQAPLTMEAELLKLIRLQKIRVGIDFSLEVNMNKLFNTTNKEIDVLRELMMDYAKLKGLVTENNTGSMGHYDENVKADLQSLQMEEKQRAQLTSVVRELATVAYGS